MTPPTIRLLTAAAILAGSACDGPPARVVVGTSDTVIVNSLRPVQLPAAVFDASGHALPDTGARYEWIAGDSVVISATGKVTCSRSADATIRVSLASVVTTAQLLCRPVDSVRIVGPIQLVVGDSAQEIPVHAVGVDGNPVESLAGTATILDSSIATLRGLRVSPRKPGSTVAWLRIGDHSPGIGVHVYERVSTLNGLRPDQRYATVFLQLAGGEVRRWPLPPGTWMLTMLPYDHEARGLRLRVEGANCVRSMLTPRRYTCLAKDGASVTVYHPFMESQEELSGQLLLREVNH